MAVRRENGNQMLATDDVTSDKPVSLGTHELTSRLIVGTGKYSTLELMQDPVPVTGGLGASYLHPFPENWEEKDVEGWINLYLMVSILF